MGLAKTENGWGSGWSEAGGFAPPPYLPDTNPTPSIFFNNFDMETPAFIYAIFLWFLLISVTGYSIYVGFGPPSKELKDPFEDHED